MLCLHRVLIINWFKSFWGMPKRRGVFSKTPQERHVLIDLMYDYVLWFPNGPAFEIVAFFVGFSHGEGFARQCAVKNDRAV